MAVSGIEGRGLLSWALRRERQLSLPVPFAGLISIFDALALVGATALTRGADPIAMAYALATFITLSTEWIRTCRIAARFGDDAGWLLVRMSGPALIALTLGAGGVWDPGALVPASIALVMVGRVTSYRLQQAARSRGLIQERTVIVGAGLIGSEMASILIQYPEYGLLPIGFVDSSERADLPLPMLGDIRDLGETIRQYDIRRVIIAFGATREPDVVRAIRACDPLPVFLHYVPRFFELRSSRRVATDDLRGIPLVPLPRPARRPGARLLKRTFDVIGASISLIVTAPLLIAGALAVRLTSPGPVIFRQERIGREGRPFVIYKLRTMRENNGSDTDWLGSDLVTPVGRILRKTSIDELPQLVNVLRGEMSLVGPRPERPHFVEQFRRSVHGYDARHRVAGGISGWAQVHGRDRELSSIPERARFDNYYIEHWSAWLDLVVIVRTLKSVLTRGS
jgi:exopolysaccharide biosynthesis polyprenyl glycosylphosphotransferase